MTLEWTPLSEFRKFLKNTLRLNHVNQVFSSIKNPVLQLFTTFPAPDNWLAVPPEERATFRHRDSRDLWYVIFWAWHTGFCKGNDVVAQYRRNDLVCYLSTRGRVNLSDFPVKMGLLKNSEAEHIRKKDSNRIGLFNKLSIHLLGVMKPLGDFTEEDIALADVMRPNDKRYNAKCLKDILFELGYSDEPGRRRQRILFDDCCEHPKWGDIAREFREHLKRSNSLDYYIRKAGSALHKFFKWLDQHGESDASSLEYEDFLDLFDYISKNNDGEEFSAKYTGNNLGFIRFQGSFFYFRRLVSMTQKRSPKSDRMYPWYVLSVTSLGAFLVLVNIGTLNVALPELSQQFHANAAASSWILLSYMLVNTILILIFGQISDIFGRSRMYLIGMAIFTVSSLLLGYAFNVEVLILLRIVQAAGGALVVTNTTPLITDAFPQSQLGTGLGLNLLSASVAQVLGPVVGGVVTTA